MPTTGRMRSNDAPRCPDCLRELSFIGSWDFRDRWGYTEVRTYECPAHGPIFVSPQVSVEHCPPKEQDKDADSGDRDSMVSSPLKPTPIINADAIAIPEPESN
jgi:hypothetical protein